MQPMMRSRRTNVFLFRLFWSFLCLAFATGLSRGNLLTRNFFLASPFLVAAFFGWSIAVIEVNNGIVRYRHLFKWTTIPHDEILDARLEWAPFVASVRLQRFHFPWGRMYFFLDANASANPFRDEYPLLNYICNHSGSDSQNVPTDKGPSEESGSNKMVLVIAAITGSIVYAIAYWLKDSLLPGITSHGIAHPSHMILPTLGIVSQVSNVLGSFQTQVACFVICASLAVFRRHSHYAPISSFLAGFSIPYVVLHVSSMLMPGQ
jgi:hypothetical protein